LEAVFSPAEQGDIMVALRRYRRGLTLVELVVAVFVLLMIVLIGMPAFTNMMAQRRLMGAVGRVSADLRSIQSRAVRLGYKHQLSYAAGSYTLQSYNTATNAYVSLGPSYSVATDYTGVSLASIIDNAGAGVNVAAIVFRPQGDVDPTIGTFPIVLTVSGTAGTRAIQVTRSGSIRMPAN
jgi:Tfp pilus assembly protein FimT